MWIIRNGEQHSHMTHMPCRIVSAKISSIVCIIMMHTQLVGIVNQIMSKWQTFARVDMQQKHHQRQQQSIINTNSFVALSPYIVVKIDNHMNIWLASKSFIFIRFICLILECLLAFVCVCVVCCSNATSMEMVRICEFMMMMIIRPLVAAVVFATEFKRIFRHQKPNDTNTFYLGLIKSYLIRNEEAGEKK